MKDAMRKGGGLSRRDFTRLLAMSGSIPWLTPGMTWANPAPLPQTPPAAPNEAFWLSVRDQFVMPKDLGVMNAANLCPSSAAVLQRMYDLTKDMDMNPSPQNRRKLGEGKEAARKALADFLRVSPEEIVITRNTSEANNTISSGLELKAGDEVVIFADNHPSNNAAWKKKAERYGYTVTELQVPNPHPGAEYYINAVTKALTARTKVLAFTHLTNTNGDLFPAKELCKLARDRGVLVHLDGAQSFGLLDVDLSDIQPDFYTGSGHKWPCGPKEVGVLYIRRDAQSKVWPSIVSAGSGPIGASKAIEGYGQRDEPAIMAFTEALNLQTKVGRKNIENRSRQLAQSLMEGLSKIDGIKLMTSRDPARSAAVVRFNHSLDGAKLNAAFYERDKLAFAGGGNSVRVSPHFYNTQAEVDRTIAAVKRYVTSGFPTSAA